MQNEIPAVRTLATTIPQRTRKARRVPIGLVSLALCASATVTAQESQVPCTSGQAPMCFGEWASCSISPATDIDVYQVYAAPGERFRVAVDGLSNNLDPKIEIYDPTNALIGSKACGANSISTCSVSLAVDTTLYGLYSIVISDSGTNNTGGYSLDLQKLTPDKNLVGVIDYGQSKTIQLDHGADHDWLRFDALANTNVRISVAGLSNNLDCQLEIWAPDGTVDAQACSANSIQKCSFTYTISSTLPGTYYLALSDSGSNNAGSMSVGLSCILGNCPPNPPAGSVGFNYCTSKLNSSNSAAQIAAFGSAVAEDNDFLLSVSGAPPAKSAIFFMGSGQTQAPFFQSQGFLCVQPPLRRLPIQFVCNDGTLTYQLDLAAPPTGGPPIVAGQTWNFQGWFRDVDPNTQAPTTNLSDGLEVAFQ